jgi:FlaA1/EpsC-like NDP-sugar epimerase
MRLDQMYVHHRSLILDMDVFIWTFLVMLPRLGSFKPPEKLLFFGPMAKIAKRYANWLVIDFVISFLAFGISGIFWRTIGPINLGVFFAVFLSFAFSLLFSLVGALFGIQKIVWSTASVSEVFDLAMTTIAAASFALIINHNQIMPYQIIILASLIAFLGFVVVRYRKRFLDGITRRLMFRRRLASKFREKVLIVGSGKAGEFAAWLMHNGPNANRYQVIGFVDDDILKQDIKFRGVKVLGDSVEISEIVRNADVGLILFAIHNIQALKREKILQACRNTSAKVVLVPDVMGAIEQALQNNAEGETTKEGLWGEQLSQSSDAPLGDLLTDLEEDIKQGNISSSLARIEELRARINGKL